MRLPEVAARFESDVEKLIREHILRGSVQLSFQIRRNGASAGYAIDSDVLQAYVSQMAAVRESLKYPDEVPALADLLQLPGVVAEAGFSGAAEESIWPLMKSAVTEALAQFHDFRLTEGESMRVDLANQCDTIETQLAEVETKAPEVVSGYREKLLERVRKAIGDTDIPVEDKDVIREVAMFADRCDINEEITRLRSHIQQFNAFLNGDKSLGRKLEFVSQEMFREINTIGSKANNVGIAHCVVEMKAAIERIREVLQNVE